jgi:hypothetical protein
MYGSIWASVGASPLKNERHPSFLQRENSEVNTYTIHDTHKEFRSTTLHLTKQKRSFTPKLELAEPKLGFGSAEVVLKCHFWLRQNHQLSQSIVVAHLYMNTMALRSVGYTRGSP